MPGDADVHFVTRTLLELFRAGRLPRVRSVEAEPGHGYMAAITYRDGSVRVTRGSDTGINAASAHAAALNKIDTRWLLGRAGVRCPEGTGFRLAGRGNPFAAARRGSALDAAAAVARVIAYVRDGPGFPVVLKPAEGQRGIGVWRCDTEEDVERTVGRYGRDGITAFLVEEFVDLPDHRLVVLDGTLVYATLRFPLAVTGDGRRSLRDLLAARDGELRAAGMRPRAEVYGEQMEARLRREGRAFTDVPAAGETVRLIDISNLPTGSDQRDVTAATAPAWADLATAASRYAGLRFAGVDLACADLSAPPGPSERYAVYELNSTPVLEGYSTMGPRQARVVDDLYARIFNEPGHPSA
ncbi:hypothetical protein [Actinomadura fibrosa]|uniref:ATP-grasp domain-containing protein n=1 Tax=Actinomadura fibrosa TaxID=111802 RepID=A0ABW2XWX3_9ACTN|nr:hypothetical protein [Actinomadura fibrosa]